MHGECALCAFISDVSVYVSWPSLIPLHTQIHTHTHTCSHTHSHSYTHTPTLTHTLSHTHSHIHTFSHTYTVTHTHTLLAPPLFSTPDLFPAAGSSVRAVPGPVREGIMALGSPSVRMAARHQLQASFPSCFYTGRPQISPTMSTPSPPPAGRLSLLQQPMPPCTSSMTSCSQAHSEATVSYLPTFMPNSLHPLFSLTRSFICTSINCISINKSTTIKDFLVGRGGTHL